MEKIPKKIKVLGTFIRFSRVTESWKERTLITHFPYFITYFLIGSSQCAMCIYLLNIVFLLIVTLKRVIFNYFFSYLLSKEKSADLKGQSLHHTLKRSLQIEGFQNFFFGALEIDSIDKLISSNKGNP